MSDALPTQTQERTLGPSGPRPSVAGTRTARESAAALQAQALERHERAELRALGRRMWPLPVSAWPLFGLVDVRIARELFPASLLPSLATRAAVWALFLAVWALWRSSVELTRRQLVALVGCATIAMNVGLGVLAFYTGGLRSHHASGAMLAVVPYIYLALPWRSALAPVLLTALAYPVTTALLVSLSPALAPQWSSPVARLAFENMLGLYLGIAVMALGGGQLVWSLRRQVFESRSIGRYELRRKLGAGGMGEVWAAWHSGLKRLVALKLLRGGQQDPVAVARLEREVSALGELTHPNTVRVFDYGSTDDGLWYYAMELLHGVSLEALVELEGAQSPERSVHFALQAARALAEAHARGIIHRDLKPANLFVTNAGGERDFLKLLDFGIARREGAQVDATLTQAGHFAGTPYYLSPEALRGERVGPAADVYGLGGVLYFLLTGRPPFERESVGAVLTAHLLEPVVPPSSLAAFAIPEELEALVLRCLAKEPRDRFADAGALAEALAASSLAGRWEAGRELPVGSAAAQSEAEAPTVEAPQPGPATE